MLTILFLIVMLLIFGARYYSLARKEHRKEAKEETYIELARRSIQSEELVASTLAEIKDKTKQIESRLGQVEKVLKEV